MFEALTACAAKFREYEQQHAAKAEIRHPGLAGEQERQERLCKASRNREMAELCEKALEETWPAMQMLRRLVHSLDELIAESGGVYGLLNGGVNAPWDELLEGGTYDGWLRELDEARRMIDRGQDGGRHHLSPLLRYVHSREADLTNRQTTLLMLVAWTPGPHRVRVLATTMKVSKPVITRAITTLAQLGLMKREHTDEDRRECFAVVTPKGKAFLERVYG